MWSGVGRTRRLLAAALPLVALSRLRTRAAPAEDLVCNSVPVWRSAKETVVKLAADVSPAADDPTISDYLKEAMDAGLLVLPKTVQSQCLLGARTFVHVALLVFDKGLPPDEIDLLDERSLPYSFGQVITSGWPLFGLAAAYQRNRYPTYQETSNLVVGCEELKRRAEGVLGSQPLLHPDKFSLFLWQHLQLRPRRRRLPVQPVRAFLAFSRQSSKGGVCQMAVATAELALALALLSSTATCAQLHRRGGSSANGTSVALRLTGSAELRLRSWWRSFADTMFLAAATSEDPGALQRDVQMRLLVRWPVFELLQGIQDALFLTERRDQPIVGTPQDRNPAAHAAELVKKGPAFWEERRRLLHAAILGPAERWPQGLWRPPLVRAHGRGGGAAAVAGATSLVLTWDLGRMNATALFMPSWSMRAKGLVLLHNGHDGTASTLEVRPDPYRLIDFIVGLGFDVISLCMPYLGFNHLGAKNPIAHNHDVFARYHRDGDEAVLAYFVAPVILALDWAETELGHTNFAMVGFSGGGWTTYLAAALDPRLSLSIAAVATLPPHLVDGFDWTRYDYELRYKPQHVYEQCSMMCIFALSVVGGLSRKRRETVHLFHLQEDYPYPTPNGVLGIEAEMEEYYTKLLPRVVAAATGEAAESSGMPSPLQLVLTNSHHHVGAWRDFAVLEVLFERWAALGAAGQPGGSLFAGEWPLAVDVRHSKSAGAAGSCAP